MSELKTDQATDSQTKSLTEDDDESMKQVLDTSLAELAKAQGRPASRARAARGARGARGETRNFLTRELVVNRARQILQEEGYEALSLRSLASQLGVTAPALYGYVANKRDLLEKLSEDGYQRLSRALESHGDENPIALIHQNAQTYLDFARENQEQFRTMMLFRPEDLDENYGDQAVNASAAVRHGSNIINRAVELGLIECHDVMQVHLAISGAIYGVTRMILSSPDHDRDQEDCLLYETVAAILRGLQPLESPQMQDVG